MNMKLKKAKTKLKNLKKKVSKLQNKKWDVLTVTYGLNKDI